jgi:pimeloyl-ACP methyl ester carboxylesterase
MTNIDKIKVVDDHRVQRQTIRVNDKTYGAMILSHLTHIDEPPLTYNRTIGYLIAEPASGFSHTVLLVWSPVMLRYEQELTSIKIHGFPDLSMGWRYQIPFFLQHGFRVVCPDCIGYGRSVGISLLNHGKKYSFTQDSPTESLSPYSLKSQCQDFRDLAEKLGCRSIIAGGHDW